MLSIETDAMADLAAQVGTEAVVPPHAIPAQFLKDWSGDWVGSPRALVRPRDRAGVAAVMRWARAKGVPVTVQGGHTGLVGGASASGDGREVLLSLDRLSRVRQIDMLAGAVEVEAGCVLEKLKSAVAAEGGLLPITLGSQGSCQIGGNISTNAGGINVMRHGMTRDLVLGLEVVLADGQVLSDLRPLRKKNLGCDWKQLFIGSEGTLGVVTAACLRIIPAPNRVETLWMSTDSVAGTLRLFQKVRAEAGDLLSAFELIEEDCLRLAEENGLTPARPAKGAVHALVEFSAAGGPPLRPWLDDLLATLLVEGLVEDGALATSGAHAADFWAVREMIIEGQMRAGRHLRTDVSVPIAAIDQLVAGCADLVSRHVPGGRPIAYGHVGDGNIHINVVRRRGTDAASFAAALPALEASIYDLVDKLDGAISAEHGVGTAKRDAFRARTSPEIFSLLQALKLALDPEAVLNRDRIFKTLSAGDEMHGHATA
jgi:FAD/FMN-containing dehydrogenase